jgi:hypothetical protein
VKHSLQRICLTLKRLKTCFSLRLWTSQFSWAFFIQVELWGFFNDFSCSSVTIKSWQKRQP